MLFRPTNITPDLTGALGNGTIDATAALTVSWQVNGNSAMTAYTIVIYTNDAASTQVYTTGKVSITPFYGTKADGSIEFFEATPIPANTVTNGNEYKLVITQYWTDSNNVEHSVVQSSASAFRTRAVPALTLTAISSPLAVRTYTFTATYSQAQGDALNYVRWMLALDGQENQPLFDSGNIYGTAELSMTYDGLFPDNTYSVRCMVQTENGIDADTGWTDFDVSYALADMEGILISSPVVTPLGVCGVSLNWTRARYTPGAGFGDYSISGGILNLPNGAGVEWDTVNGDTMSFDAPWSVFYKGEITPTVSADMFTVYGANEGYYAVCDGATQSVELYYEDENSVSYLIGSISSIPNYATVTIALTPTSYAIRVDTFEYVYLGLVPSDSLYPAEDLYPDDSIINYITMTDSGSHSYPQTSLEYAALGYTQKVHYFQIVEGEANISGALDGTYAPTYTPDTYFLADFEDGTLNAGNVGSATTTGYALYRAASGDGTLHHVGDFPLGTNAIFDLFPPNTTDGETYTYWLWPIDTTALLAEPFTSDPIAVCDWAWTLLSCEWDEDNEYYTVDEAFRFSKNVTTGSMSNGNSPSTLKNFTRYPTVQRDTANFKGGTLQSLIGIVGANTCVYSDTKAMRDAIYALSTTQNTLFLKSRKGDIMCVAITSAVTMDTADDTKEQAQTVSVSWAEIADAKTASIVYLP